MHARWAGHSGSDVHSGLGAENKFSLVMQKHALLPIFHAVFHATIVISHFLKTDVQNPHW